MKPTLWRNSDRSLARRGYPLMSLFDEMNRFFEDSWPASTQHIGKSTENFVPKLEVRDSEKEIVIVGEFPGMSVGDINVEFTAENTLTLSGEKKYEQEHKEGDKVYIERSFGSFQRTIPLSVEVDEDNSSAEMKNGVLTIRIPKSARELRGNKKLSIKSS